MRDLLRAHSAGLGRIPDAIESLVSGAKASAGAPGQRMGDYELLEEVGSGAFGSVWRARQVSLERVVALKVLRAGRLAGAAELASLRAEAEAVARLDHPGIVPVHEVGEHAGHAFFSMKWIEGGTLALHLDEPWPARRAAELLVEIARAVHHAHQRGLLHRDLKPSNVLLDAEGRPHVVDFGIAMRIDADEAAGQARALAGTPAYMAPEQASGAELTVATDVWALGCLLYELLAGQAAFAGGSLDEVLHRVRHGEPARLSALRPSVPRDLEAIVHACLRKEPALRYASAAALADDLERWLAHEPVAARRAGAFDRLALFCARSPLAATLTGVVSGLVLLLAVTATWASLELSARLRESYLGQARATRLAGAAGARQGALALLARAAAIRPGEDLRDEAIACLALTDLVRERTVDRPPGLQVHLVPDPALERLALGDERGLRVLAFDDGSELARLDPASDVTFLRWSPGGRWLLSKHHAPGDQGRDARLRVWDVGAGTELWSRDEAISYRSVAFAHDERRLAYGTLTGEVLVLELPGGEERLRLDAGARTGALAFRRDGRELAVGIGGGRNVLEIRDAESGALLHQASLPSAPFDLCWTADGRLAVACGDFRVYLFDEGSSEPRIVCEGHSAEVVEVFACPAAPLLASHSWDETTRLWDATTGRELRRLSARALGFSPEGLRLGLTDARTWSLWKVEHGAVLRTLRVHRGKSPRDLSFSPDGKRLATAGPDGVYLTDVGAGSPPQPVLDLPARSVRFLAQGRELAVSGESGLWRLELEPGSQPRQLLSEPLWSLALSADGRTLAAQGVDAVYLLDPLAPGEARRLPGAEHMEYVSISADGSRVAAGNWRGKGVRLWSPREGDAPRLLFPEQVNVAVALSPDGELLATGSSERFELWRVATGERLFAQERQRAFGNAPAPVAFRPDGALVAFAVSNEVVRLLDVRELASRGTLEAPQLEALFEIAFSPDGSTLGTACATNRVQLWNLAALERELDALGLGEVR
ncbi:MAG TPA: protein kinase [Planctomycetota bacterium]|nr:protein kinase [Planctomycetota bacterium]